MIWTVLAVIMLSGLTSIYLAIKSAKLKEGGYSYQIAACDVLSIAFGVSTVLFGAVLLGMIK